MYSSLSRGEEVRYVTIKFDLDEEDIKGVLC